MRSILHVALNDLRLHLKDRAGLFFLVLMPVGFIFFFGVAFRGDNSGPESVQVTLPVVREDDGWLADVFVEKLAGQSFNVDVYTPLEAENAALDTRYITIPAGFTESVLQGEQVSVGLTKKADSSVTYDMAAEVKLNQALVSFLGDLASWESSREKSEDEGSTLSEAAKGRLVMAALREPRVALSVSHAGKGRPVPSGMAQSVPGVMTMFVVMTVLIGGSEALTREKKDGTLRRLATTPVSRWQILGGKVLGLTFLGVVQAAILVVASELLARFGVLPGEFSWDGQYLGLLLLLTPYAFAAACVALFLSGLFRTTKQAESIAWLVGMAFAALGGTWWPMEVVPLWMQKLGHAFPTAWAMDGLHGLVTFGGGLSSIVLPSLVLIAYGLAFAALGARTMRVTS